MTIDTTKLRELAMAADGHGLHIYTHPRDSRNHKANAKFIEATSTGTVLALLDELHRLQQEFAADATEIAKLNHMLDALREERTTLRAMLAYAAKEADDWHDEARGGSIENDARFDEIRKYLEALK